MSAGSDGRIAELFARAEVKRRFCGHHDAVFAATPKPVTWLDSLKEPQLRGRLTSR
jgi:hypothetical protein